MSQHNFKLFSGEMKGDRTLSALRTSIEQYVVKNNITPKSIGIEYLESVQKVIITLGYSTGETAVPVKINLLSLGKIAVTSEDFTTLEKQIGETAASQRDIICHELFIDETNEFFMLFMVKA